MSDILKYNSPIRLAQLSSDPSGAENGVLYYNTISNNIRQYLNGSWSDVPNKALTLLGLALNNHQIIVGNGSNLSAAVDSSSTGDILVDSSTGLTIKTGVIVNSEISASANISLSKLAALTANRALQSDGSGVISASSVTNTELGYVSGVTSAIQTQLNSKQASGNYITALTGDVAATGPGSAYATIQSGAVTASKLGTVTDGVTLDQSGAGSTLEVKAGGISNTQVNASAAIARSKLASGTAYAILVNNASGVMSENAAITANQAVISDANGQLTASSTTATELSYVHNVTSSIQTQLNATEKTANKGAANGYAPLDGSGKVPYANLPSALMTFKGAWNASTNTPTLADGTGTSGDTYRASVAGTQNLGSGSQTFAVGDFIVYNGTIWQHSPAADGVSSVNGQTGAVTVNAINQLSGDVTTSAASGSQSEAATVAKIQGTTVSGTTGSGNVVFSASPTLTGTLTAATISASGNVTGSNLSGTNTGDQTITLTGDVTGSGTGSFAATLATVNSNVGSFGDASHTPSVTVNAKGLVTAASSNSIQITESQVTNLVSDLAGKQPTGNYITALTGDVTASGPGSSAATIANSAVTNAKMANMAAHTYKGNNTGSSAAPADITSTQLTADLNLFTSSLQGLVPASGGGTPNILRADGTFAAPSGTGGTVTTVSVVSANGLAGSVANATSTPAITLSTTVTGLLKGNGTAISAAVSGTDYQPAGNYPLASTGDINQTSYTGLANNTANQNITGLSFNNATVRSAQIQLSIALTATTNQYAVYELNAIQRGSDWQMTDAFTGDSITGLSFTITTAGQVQASIGNISGFSSAKIQFRAWTMSV